tara:strand:+ start:424 stop:714 length:291 start_codon:yes stop_codon:yes gene_type:complete
MGYLNTRDYNKIENIIDTFVDNPMISQNLLKSLKLFLNTKNEISIKTEVEYKFENLHHNTDRITKIIDEADVSLDKFSDKLLNDSRKFKKNSKTNR